MATDRTPVIRRDWQSKDSNATVTSVVKDKTQFHRGMGRSGRRVEHTDLACPLCDHENTIRVHRMHPECRDTADYWCLNPNCHYFVGDELSWATRPHPAMAPEAPMVFSQTHECTECDSRETREVERHTLHDDFENGVVQHVCEECAEEVHEHAR